MITGFGNNVVSSLASDITSTQTSFAVMPGTGEQFSKLLTTDIINVDSPHEIYAKLTITDSQQTVFEICHLMSVSQDTLTVIRAQEGTSAKGWSLNDVVANFATRGSEQGFVQVEQLQAGDFTAATAGGSANALAISLPSTFFINGSSEFILRVPLLIKPILNNSGPVTIQLTVSGRVIGTYPIVKGINTNLIAGDIVKDNPIYIIFAPELSRFIIINPVNGLVDGELFLQKSQNLSDVANKSTARTNLELKGAALVDIGKTPGTAAAGDDDRIVNAISIKDTNIQLPGNLGVKNLEVHPMPNSTEGGQIDLYDKADARAAFIDIDTNGSFRIVNTDMGVVLTINRLTGKVSINKDTTINGELSSSGSFTTVNGNIVTTNGNIAAGGRADITSDIRGGRVLSKSDVIVGEGQAGGYATINSTGNINGSQWGGLLSNYLSNRGVRAWAAVRGDGAMLSGFGFSAINRTNVGGYNFTMTTSNGAYAVVAGINAGTQNGGLNAHSPNIWNRTANSFSIQNARDGGVSYDWTDWPEFYVIVVGP